MNKILNNLGKSVLTFLIILLIGLGWAFVELKIMLKSNLELFGYVFYQIEDSQKLDVFNVDDVAIVQKNTVYNKGDRVMYLDTNGKYIISNVLNAGTLATTLECLNCENEVSSITVNNTSIIGKAIGKFAYLGKIVNFFKQKWFLTLLAIVGFTFIVLSQQQPFEKVEKPSLARNVNE